MKSWLAREDKLKQVVEQNADKTIPDLKLLSDQDWLNAAREAKFDTDQDVRHTLANLRHMAETAFAVAAPKFGTPTARRTAKAAAFAARPPAFAGLAAEAALGLDAFIAGEF